KVSRIELLLELDHRVINHVLATVHRSEGQFVLREKMRHTCDIHDCRSVADSRRDPLEASAWSQMGRELPCQRPQVTVWLAHNSLELADRTVQALLLDWFQQVVDRIHREGINRVVIVGGGEDHERIAIESFEQLESCETGHLDVQK